MTKIIYNKDKSFLEEEASKVIADSINKLLDVNDSVVFAIPGGRSVAGIFKLLIKKNISWERVHIFMIDERLVTLDDNDSNFKLAKENFLDELVSLGKLKKKNIHPFIFDKDKSDFGISDYEEEIKKFGGYDIILLSSGEDGHVGALYPNHHSINDESNYYITMSDSPKPPKKRMSSSKKLLVNSKVSVLLFLDDIKKDAYEKFLDSKFDIENCPAKLVNLINESFVFTNISGD